MISMYIKAIWIVFASKTKSHLKYGIFGKVTFLMSRKN